MWLRIRDRPVGWASDFSTAFQDLRVPERRVEIPYDDSAFGRMNDAIQKVEREGHHPTGIICGYRAYLSIRAFFEARGTYQSGSRDLADRMEFVSGRLHDFKYMDIPIHLITDSCINRISVVGDFDLVRLCPELTGSRNSTP